MSVETVTVETVETTSTSNEVVANTVTVETVVVGVTGPQGPAGSGGGGGAPTDATYLVATSNGTLTDEVVVGATPGGELGGTWASPTVDATHSGSSHASVQAAAEATAAAALSAHEADTTGVHGISDTSALVLTGDSRLSDARTPTAHKTSHQSGGSDELALATSQITGLDEQIRDVIGTALVAGSNVTITVDDPGDTITIASTGGGGGSLTVQEGDVTVSSAASTLDFAAADFDVTESPSGEANIALASAVYKSGGTDVAVADGGTGSSTASGARTNLGLIIGTDVQAYDADLGEIAAISNVRGDLLVTNSTPAWDRLAVGATGQILRGGTDPAWGYGTRVLGTQHSSRTISSSSGWTTETTATSIFASAFQVAAGTLGLGDILRLQAHGTMINNSGGSLAYTFTIGANTVGSVYTSSATTSTLATSATGRLWNLDLTFVCDDTTSLTNLSITMTGHLMISGTTSAPGDGLHAVGALLLFSSAVNSGLNVNSNALSLDVRVASGGTTDTQSFTTTRAFLTHIPKVT